MVTQKCCVCLVLFESVCLFRCSFGSQTWNHLNSTCLFPGCLSFWTWAFERDSSLFPVLRCHLLQSASLLKGILAPFINGFYRTLCCVTDYSSVLTWHLSLQVLQKPPPSTRSQSSLPAWSWELGGLVATLHWLHEGGRVTGPFSRMSPSECPPPSDWYWLSVSGHWGSLLAMDPTPTANK